MFNVQDLDDEEIKSLYRDGKNVMQAFREHEDADTNSLRAIQSAYDLQAGSYVRMLEDPIHAEFVNAYSAVIAKLLRSMQPLSILEAGVGEATTLANVLRHMPKKPDAFGFDLSWKRTLVGQKYAESQHQRLSLFSGELSAIPLAANAVDVVYTSHSIEPNRGREKEILRELYRVARRFMVLLEPSNELGGGETQAHIEHHKYCLNLSRHAKELGYSITEHRLFDLCKSQSNQTALLIIPKN